MSIPLAYFLTWTTYGTRLHGDDRGSVDREHNYRGSPILTRSVNRVKHMRSLLTHAPLVLSDAMRESVHQTIVQHCQFRRWTLSAINVRTNHVHVVVRGAHEKGPEDVMGQLKSWSTHRLRESGLVEPHREVWTSHGSTIWINTEESLRGAIDCTLNQQ